MPPTPLEILETLTTSDATLAFCDETDITQQATSTMVANIHLWAALIIPSKAYAALGEALSLYRTEHALPEFHANEIVTPGKGSPWRAVDPSRRLAAMRHACMLASDPACTLRYVHIPLHQYEALRDEHANVAMPGNYKSAVKTAFLGCLAEVLADAPRAIVVMDRTKPRPQPTIAQVAGAPHLVGGGAVYADSASVPGLQLADVAAYAVGRFIRRRDRIAAGQQDAFDELMMTTVAAFQDRFINMLSTPS